MHSFLKKLHTVSTVTSVVTTAIGTLLMVAVLIDSSHLLNLFESRRRVENFGILFCTVAFGTALISLVLSAYRKSHSSK